ncbi:hypothetical protein JJD41_14695 [Oxynema sp. CENA135]|nr:hypothetical protein [Oxynema sp. CENA135]MBK4731099.1 hypothetical protein [Oxynema sp. CENA135]
MSHQLTVIFTIRIQNIHLRRGDRTRSQPQKRINPAIALAAIPRIV